MWLDRLSGHSTPSPPPPSVARRPTHLAPTRPGFSPRSSSLVSLVSNDSTTSLLAPSKRPNGSTLKQSTVISDAPDPLDVLRNLLNDHNDRDGQSNVVDQLDLTSLAEKELAVDFGGLSLRELAQGVSPASKEIHVYKEQSLDDYARDKSKLEELHRSIRACDDVLNSVEVNLTSFQNDLEAVSAEIETLQARSTALNARLGNRKLVERALGPVVEEISISPAVVRKISEGVIDESWVKALAEVDKRSKSLDAKAKDHKNVKGVTDLKPLLENLINKALERIRDFLVAQIKALRSPNINAQIIQQQCFVKYKDLYTFLAKHHSTLAEELSKAYMNTMRWYYSNQFTRYLKALEKLRIHALDKHDVLGNDDAPRKAMLLSSAKPVGPPHDAFNLGRRIDLLKTSNQVALPSYLAEEDTTYHYLEYPFRNFNIALIDNASAEYSFLTTFFSPSLSFKTISRNFNYIFEPTFKLGEDLTRSLVAESVDCLGVLMCVRLNQAFAFELQRRKIPAVDSYINGTSMLLWPRFQVVMDMHIDSLRKATAAIPTTTSASSRWTSSTPDPAKQSAAPHFLTQRFAQFLQGILSLSTQAADDEPVSLSLARLRAEVSTLLARLSMAIADTRMRKRFLVNNYSLILTIISDVEGKLAAEQMAHFEEARAAFGEGA